MVPPTAGAIHAVFCGSRNGVFFASTDLGVQNGARPCTDVFDCQGLQEWVNDPGGSYCYNPFLACVAEAPSRRMLGKKEGEEMR